MQTHVFSLQENCSSFDSDIIYNGWKIVFFFCINKHGNFEKKTPKKLEIRRTRDR